jgi:hypothetical protein
MSKRYISISAKCSDLFSASLFNDGQYQGKYDGYVPSFLPGEHYGDYIELDIDIDTGQILNWTRPTNSSLKIFKK